MRYYLSWQRGITALLVLFCCGKLFAQDLTFQPIYFSKGKSNLNKAAKEGADRVYEILKSNPDTKLKLEGYAGNSEGEDNQKLADDRARNVMNYLIQKHKIAATRLDSVGKVEAMDPRNQKVEFVFESSKPKEAEKAGLEEIEVLYWNTLYHCLYQIGVDQKYFEEQGFKVKLVATNHSYINQVDAVCGIEPFLREKVTVFSGSVCGGSPHQAAAQGVPLVVIGGMLAGGSMLMAKPEMAQKLRANPQNFKGITIGRPKGTVLTAMIIADFLKKNKLDWKKDVKWKEYNTHEEVVDAMAKGQIDAGDTYVPLNIRAHKEYGLVEVYNTVELFPYHPCCRVITTKQKLKEERPKYVRFLKALIKSHEFFIKQPRKSWEIVQRYTGYTMEEVQSSLTNPNFILNPDPLKNGFVKFWKMMNDTGYIHSNADINQYIDTSVYEDALKSLSAEEPKNPYFAYMTKQFKENNF